VGTGKDAGVSASGERFSSASPEGWRRQASVYRIAGAVLLVLLGLVVAAARVPYDAEAYDEGLIANGAALALKGQLPAADFYAPYPPGAFLALALVFRIWGVRLLAERWFAFGLASLVGPLAFWLITGLGEGSEPGNWREWWTAGVAGLAATLLATSRWMTPVNGGALVLALASGIAVRAALPRSRPHAAFLCGTLAGAVGLWRLDFGLYVLFSNVAVWFLSGGGWGREPARHRIGGVLALGLGALTLAIPILGWIVARGGKRAARSLFLWPISSTAAAHLPWQRHEAAFILPLLALALLPGAGPALRRDPCRRAMAVWFFLLGLGFLAYALGRTHASHLLPLRVVSLLLTALLLGGSRERSKEDPEEVAAATGSPRISLTASRLAAVAFLLVACPLLIGPMREYALARRLPTRGRLPLPGPRGAGVYPSPIMVRDYTLILAYLAREASPGTRIYCGAPRHDLFIKSDNLAYFLAGRESGTYFWCLDAGITSGLRVQQEMVRELEAARVGVVVIPLPRRHCEPNAGSQSSGVHLLDDYLRRQFRLSASWDRCQIYRRRGEMARRV
jgi:hypothetical protein